tara:strand:- start:328 stop:651 length:324 start_codon:yes stop_codon:yes gene_type:complete
LNLLCIPSVDGIIHVDHIHGFIVWKKRSILPLSCQLRTLPFTLPLTCFLELPAKLRSMIADEKAGSHFRSMQGFLDQQIHVSFVLGPRAKTLIISSLREYPSSTAVI